MKQILYIHWWTLAKDIDELINTMNNWDINPFEEKKRWRMTLEKRLPGYQVIKPEMPNKELASYRLWKYWFEKHLPFLTWEEVDLIGHSLWAMFLLKYVGENTLPFKIHQLHIVSPVLDEKGLNDGDNYLWDFAYNPEVLRTLPEKADKIWVWHSKDDKVVPFNHSERIVEYIPGVTFMVFEDREHFNQAEFPELIKTIQEN